MDKQIEKLNKQKDKIEKEIKKIQWETHSKKIFERGKESIGNCYRFRNSWSDSHESWYIWAEVIDCVFENDSVYAVVNTYERQYGGEIIIKLGHKDLQATSWFHCWDNVRKEDFISAKSEIAKEAMIKLIS